MLQRYSSSSIIIPLCISVVDWHLVEVPANKSKEEPGRAMDVQFDPTDLVGNYRNKKRRDEPGRARKSQERADRSNSRNKLKEPGRAKNVQLDPTQLDDWEKVLEDMIE